MPTSPEVWRPSSVFIQESPFCLGLPHPASSVPGLSQSLDGFRLSRTSRPVSCGNARGVQSRWCLWQPYFCSRAVHPEGATNRRRSIHAGQDRQDTCPSLGHAGSHPVFETIKALGATRTPLTHAPVERNTGRRAHPTADQQRPPPRRLKDSQATRGESLRRWASCL